MIMVFMFPEQISSEQFRNRFENKAGLENADIPSSRESLDNSFCDNVQS